MPAVDTRNIPRDSMFLLADLAIEGQPEPRRVKVRNLSSGGMMAEGGFAVSRGERMTVTLRNIGEVRGHVAWVQGNRFGIAFESPVDPKVVREPFTSGETEAPRYARPVETGAMFDTEERRLRNL